MNTLKQKSLIVITLLGFLAVTFNGSVYAGNTIRLNSEVINGRLIPIIELNGKEIIKIQDRGKKNVFESNFERAEHIYSALIDSEAKGLDISKIRVRRYKSEYSGQIKQTRVFTVTKGDMLANDKSGYQVAKLWVQNIKENAVLLSNAGIEGMDLMVSEVVDQKQTKKYPLMSVMNTMNKHGLLLLVFQLIFIGLIQCVIAYIVYQHFHKRQTRKQQAVHSRIDQLHTAVTDFKKELKIVSRITQKLSNQKKKNPIDIANKLKAS